MELLLKLRMPNTSVESWWSRVQAPRVARPVLGDSLHLAPLCGSRIPSEITSRKWHDRGAFIALAGLSPQNNSPISNPDAGKIRIDGSITDGITLDVSKESR